MSSASTKAPPEAPTRRRSFKISLTSFRRHPSAASPASPASPAKPSPRRKNRLQELQEIFPHFDADRDGKISADDLRSVFSSDGEVASGSLSWLEAVGDWFFGFGDFVEMMTAGGECEVELRQTFEEFEGEKGSGRISPAGLQRVLRQRLREEWTVEDCQAMIRPFDLDGDGGLDFCEFRRMMTS